MGTHQPHPHGPAKASIGDTLAFLTEVVMPSAGKGLLIRRPRAVALASRLGLDARGVRCMRRLQAKYGDGPLVLALPVRRQAVVLSRHDLQRVLEGAPYPFSPATREKRAALAHFESRVSLASSGPAREQRRRLNDAVLESDRCVHSMAAGFAVIIREEMMRLRAGSRGTLDWPGFIDGWYRVVRRIVLGAGAADDRDLTRLLARLRAAANWAFLHPGHRRLRRRFHQRLIEHLARARRGSLAERLMQRVAQGKDSALLDEPGGLDRLDELDAAAALDAAGPAAADQVTHWLFAFEAAGIATFRALAVLAMDAALMRRAREEIEAARGRPRPERYPFLRACLLESLRLWPTTPLILRETTQAVDWSDGALPAHTHLLIYLPYFHRDESRLPVANQFAPDLWLQQGQEPSLPWIPFSAGPAVCPAHHLVPLLGSLTLASLITSVTVTLSSPQHSGGLRADAPMPATLDHFGLRFALAAW